MFNQSNHEETIKHKLTEIPLDNWPVWINLFQKYKRQRVGNFSFFLWFIEDERAVTTKCNP